MWHGVGLEVCVSGFTVTRERRGQVERSRVGRRAVVAGASTGAAARTQDYRTLQVIHRIPGSELLKILISPIFGKGPVQSFVNEFIRFKIHTPFLEMTKKTTLHISAFNFYYAKVI